MSKPIRSLAPRMPEGYGGAVQRAGAESSVLTLRSGSLTTTETLDAFYVGNCPAVNIHTSLDAGSVAGFSFEMDVGHSESGPWFGVGEITGTAAVEAALVASYDLDDLTGGAIAVAVPNQGGTWARIRITEVTTPSSLQVSMYAVRGWGSIPSLST